MKTLFVSLVISIALISKGHCANPPPNFIIFIADDVSWDDIGIYGNEDVKTPNIDALAVEGMKFDNAYLTASSCSPSRNSILLGRYPHNTGAPELHQMPPPESVSFPEILKDNGYYTVHSGKFHDGMYARRAFDVLDADPEDPKDIGPGGEKRWLENIKSRPKDKPFLMWFAALDGHRPWAENQFSGTHDPSKIKPPHYLADTEKTRVDLAHYYDEVHRFDHHIGEIVKELKSQKALENTFIIIMADNGRAFPHSKTRVNDRGMKTPFIVYWPASVAEGKTTRSLISAVDIAPTILELAGLASPKEFQGVSFAKLLSNPEAKIRDYVFAERNWHDFEAYERMVRDENYMYILNKRPKISQDGPLDVIRSPSYIDLFELNAAGGLSVAQADIFVTPRPKEELYDLGEDPHQWHNLASDSSYQPALGKMRKVLGSWMNDTQDSVPARLTPDWYVKLPGLRVKADTFGVRGDSPGPQLQSESQREYWIIDIRKRK